jgi:hypothetical protein
MLTFWRNAGVTSRHPFHPKKSRRTTVARITPEGFAVLSRIKRYGLDTWLPGKLVISKLHDSTYSRVNARIISDLVSTGYLATDDSGAVMPSLAGNHALHEGAGDLSESRVRIAGRLFQIVTEDWAIEADALRTRKLVIGGLEFVAQSAPEQFERIRQRTSDGLEDEALEAIVVSAMSLVTAQYSDQFAGHAHRVGVRVFEG